MKRYALPTTKTMQRTQLEQDVRAFLAQGGTIQRVDYTYNESWRHRERDRNNRYTRGDFKRL